MDKRAYKKSIPYGATIRVLTAQAGANPDFLSDFFRKGKTTLQKFAGESIINKDSSSPSFLSGGVYSPFIRHSFFRLLFQHFYANFSQASGKRLCVG